MKRSLFIWLLMVTIIAGLTSTGCKRLHRVEVGEATYRLAIDQTHSAFSEKVISATETAIKAMNLNVSQKKATNVDGWFLVSTALGNEFRIVVQATSHDRTRIRVYTGKKPNSQMARVIYENILSVM